MSNIFDVEVEVVDEIELISLEQAPVIAYDPIVAKGIEIKDMIDALGIDTIEPTEENKSLLKTTRANLNKQFAEYEAKRGEIKKLVLAPYEAFEAAYKENIAFIFNGADTKLKNKINSIDGENIAKKISYAKKLFEDLDHPSWLNFDEIGLKITVSKTESAINKEILAYVRDINKDIKAIESMENSSRILAKYQIFKDISRSIMEANNEIARENKIAREVEERDRAAAEVIPAPEPVVVKAPEPVVIKKESPQPAQQEKILSVSLNIHGTSKQLDALKAFLIENDFKFERIIK